MLSHELLVNVSRQYHVMKVKRYVIVFGPQGAEAHLQGTKTHHPILGWQMGKDAKDALALWLARTMKQHHAYHDVVQIKY